MSVLRGFLGVPEERMRNVQVLSGRCSQALPACSAGYQASEELTRFPAGEHLHLVPMKSAHWRYCFNQHSGSNFSSDCCCVSPKNEGWAPYIIMIGKPMIVQIKCVPNLQFRTLVGYFAVSLPVFFGTSSQILSDLWPRFCGRWWL